MTTVAPSNVPPRSALPRTTLRYFGDSLDEIRPAGAGMSGAVAARTQLAEFCRLTPPEQVRLVPYLAHAGFRKPFFSANWRSAMIVRALVHDDEPARQAHTLQKVVTSLAAPPWVHDSENTPVLSKRSALSNHRLQIFRLMQIICDGEIEREGQFHISAVPLSAAVEKKSHLVDRLVGILEGAAKETDVDAARRLFSEWKRRFPGLSYPGEPGQLLQPTLFTASELSVPMKSPLQSFGTMLVIMRLWCRFLAFSESSLNRADRNDHLLALQISQKWHPVTFCFNSFRQVAASRKPSPQLTSLLGVSNTQG